MCISHISHQFCLTESCCILRADWRSGHCPVGHAHAGGLQLSGVDGLGRSCQCTASLVFVPQHLLAGRLKAVDSMLSQGAEIVAK